MVGYVFTSAVSLVLGLIWPIPLAEAIAASTMLSFTLYLLVVTWVFSVKHHARMWIVLGSATTLECIAAWALLPGATP